MKVGKIGRQADGPGIYHFVAWSAIATTRLKLQYLGVEWNFKKRGMESRMNDSKTEEKYRRTRKSGK